LDQSNLNGQLLMTRSTKWRQPAQGKWEFAVIHRPTIAKRVGTDESATFSGGKQANRFGDALSFWR
jgi:hypothetical protein